MARRGDTLALPALLALALHAAAGVGLYAAGELLDDDEEEEDDGEVEVEILPPARAEPEAAPDREPQEEPETETEPVQERKTETETERERERETERAPRRPDETETVVSPDPPGEDVGVPIGDETEGDEAAPIIHQDLALPRGIGGVGVAEGEPREKVGEGGRGSNTRGGGAGARDGDGGGRVEPVSIAAIARRAEPIGGLDFVAIGKAYPPEARRLGIEGKVRVFLVVSAEGRVVQRRLITRLGHGLDELALKLAADLEFRPARDTDGRAVADKLTYTFTFRLPD